jgi:hypothetical protein
MQPFACWQNQKSTFWRKLFSVPKHFTAAKVEGIVCFAKFKFSLAPARRGKVVIASASRTKDRGFEFCRAVRFWVFCCCLETAQGVYLRKIKE